MSNPANETFGQARQGSVAAIIQVLNEHLSDIGIRTRAVVADGTCQPPRREARRGDPRFGVTDEGG